MFIWYSQINKKCRQTEVWSFCNDSARNVVIFGIDNSLLPHTTNRKKNFLVLGEGKTQSIIDRTGLADKKFSINFSKANTKLCLSLYYNGDESYLHVNKTEIYKVKVKDIMSWYNFCLGSVSKGFTKDEKSKISLHGTVYDFSVDHSSIKKEDILNIFTNI